MIDLVDAEINELFRDHHRRIQERPGTADSLPLTCPIFLSFSFMDELPANCMLPVELEREIFELAAFLYPDCMPVLVLVAQRVKSWSVIDGAFVNIADPIQPGLNLCYIGLYLFTVIQLIPDSLASPYVRLQNWLHLIQRRYETTPTTYVS
jgi:hypothetical protein